MGKVKKIIEEYYSHKPRKEYRYLTPSASMLGACPRASWAKVHGVPETTPPDVHAMQNFEVGNVTEAVIARALDQTGNLIYWWTDSQNYGATFNQDDWHGTLRSDEWYDAELHITGTPDIVTKIEDKIVLIDVKTASTTSSDYTISDIKSGKYWEKQVGYKLQLGCYFYLMKKRFKELREEIEPDHAKLIIIDKNNGSIIAEPTLFYDEQLEVEVHNRIKALNQMFREDTPPMCDCASGHKKYWGAAYCNYGVIESIERNKKGKFVPTKCCDIEYIKSNVCK